MAEWHNEPVGASIGKIVRSDSHVRYTCQIYAPGEVATPPAPQAYAFGSFVRIPLRMTAPSLLSADTLPPDDDTYRPGQHPAADAFSTQLLPNTTGETTAEVIGLIYDTLLVNPAFGTLGPRLSSDTQVELFSPDYLAERATLVSILLLGTVEQRHGATRVIHGVPECAPDLGAPVVPLEDTDIRTFHYFADGGSSTGTSYLHMGYLPHAIAQDHALLPMAMLRTIERLERIFPANASLLSIVKRNFAWHLKVQTAG